MAMIRPKPDCMHPRGRPSLETITTAGLSMKQTTNPGESDERDSRGDLGREGANIRTPECWRLQRQRDVLLFSTGGEDPAGFGILPSHPPNLLPFLALSPPRPSISPF